MITPNVFILSLFLTCTSVASSQGRWNIGYIKIDSITSKDISRLVKVDFKKKSFSESKNENSSIRYFITPKDSGQIVIWKDTIELIERRYIYVDDGSYNAQYLECPDYEPGRLLRVYENEIMEVKEDSILFRLYIEIYNKRKGKITGEPYRDSALCWISKDKLDGVMIKKQ
jgi:hypothetical protein